MTTDEILLGEIRDMRQEQRQHAQEVIQRLTRVETTVQTELPLLTARVKSVEIDVTSLNNYKNKIAGAYAAGALALGFLGSVLKQRLFGHS